MPAKKKTIKKKEIYNGRPLNKKELSIIVWLYTSDPQHRGIVERVLRDYRQTAAGRKGVRVEYPGLPWTGSSKNKTSRR